MRPKEKYRNSSHTELKAAYETATGKFNKYAAIHNQRELTKDETEDALQAGADLDYLDGVLVTAAGAGNPGFRGLLMSHGASHRGETDYQKIGRDIQAMIACAAPADYPYRSIGEFPVGRVDARIQDMMTRPRAAATGLNEGTPSEGGFLVGTDLETAVIGSMYAGAPLLDRLQTREVSANSNSLKINVIDETSRANGSRWGGCQGYWLAEAAAMTATKPKFRQLNLELKKVGALTYLTDEVMQDASALGQEVVTTHGEELRFKVLDAVINGDGAGKPLGIINSPALISVTAETGQAADTILFENILKMFARYIGGMGIWLINRDIVPQLYGMNVAVGTAGVPVYLPANGAAGSPLSTLMGWPVLELEQSPTLGDVGDILLIDPRAYLLARKANVTTAMSIHVNFTNDEVVIRSILRIDGQGIPSSTITPFKGSATRSPFIALAAR